MEQEGIRLNKYIAMAGICSRRDADKLIEEGKVSVNGKPAEPGYKVLPGDSVKVGSKLIKAKEQDEKVVLAYYKPVGVTTTERDAHAELTVGELVRYKDRVTYAGRLDKDSEGLLLLTNDGDLIHEMMQGKNAHEKEYLVKVNKTINEEMVEKLSKGIYLKDLKVTTRPCEVKRVSKNTMQIVLTQGLNRQIRRMCQAVGLKVTELKRVRVVNVTLGGLKPGEYRVLSNDEVNELRKKLWNKTNESVN